VTSHRIAIPIPIPIPYNTYHYVAPRHLLVPPHRPHPTSPRLTHSPLLRTALYKHSSSLLFRFRGISIYLNRQRLQHVENYTSRHQTHPRSAKYQLQFERSTPISSSRFQSSHQCLLTPQNLGTEGRVHQTAIAVIWVKVRSTSALGIELNSPLISSSSLSVWLPMILSARMASTQWEVAIDLLSSRLRALSI
jgi:hypothetical protein